MQKNKGLSPILLRKVACLVLAAAVGVGATTVSCLSVTADEVAVSESIVAEETPVAEEAAPVVEEAAPVVDGEVVTDESVNVVAQGDYITSEPDKLDYIFKGSFGHKFDPTGLAVMPEANKEVKYSKETADDFLFEDASGNTITTDSIIKTYPGSIIKVSYANKEMGEFELKGHEIDKVEIINVPDKVSKNYEIPMESIIIKVTDTDGEDWYTTVKYTDDEDNFSFASSGKVYKYDNEGYFNVHGNGTITVEYMGLSSEPLKITVDEDDADANVDANVDANAEANAEANVEANAEAVETKATTSAVRSGIASDGTVATGDCAVRLAVMALGLIALSAVVTFMLMSKKRKDNNE